MKEIFVMYLWENKLLKGNLKTVDGEEIEILHPGFRNDDAGPDFSDARLKIGDTTWAGHVEIHVNASDWYRHNHQKNKAYDNIILHVVYQADKDIYTTQRQKIPCLEIKNHFDPQILLNYRSFIDSRQWIACYNQLGAVQRFTWMAWLDRVIAERLEMKTEIVLDVFRKCENDWEETFYRRLMSNFGFKVNEQPFELLAQRLPFHLLLRHSDQLFQLEALLFGQAGLLGEDFSDDYPKALQHEYHFLAAKYQLKPLPPEIWRFMRMRPANFPSIRLAQMATLIHNNGQFFSRLLHEKNLGAIRALFSAQASAYWDGHFQFDKPSRGKPKVIGAGSIDLILINTVVPLLFAYAMHTAKQAFADKALMLLEALAPETNQVVSRFGQAGIVATNALQSQALLQLKKAYCNPKLCLDCRIGQVLLKTTHAVHEGI
jgi:hypothetical protein